jgi:hypothetical protein
MSLFQLSTSVMTVVGTVRRVLFGQDDRLLMRPPDRPRFLRVSTTRPYLCAARFLLLGGGHLLPTDVDRDEAPRQVCPSLSPWSTPSFL